MAAGDIARRSRDLHGQLYPAIPSLELVLWRAHGGDGLRPAQIEPIADGCQRLLLVADRVREPGYRTNRERIDMQPTLVVSYRDIGDDDRPRRIHAKYDVAERERLVVGNVVDVKYAGGIGPPGIDSLGLISWSEQPAREPQARRPPQGGACSSSAPLYAQLEV